MKTLQTHYIPRLHVQSRPTIMHRFFQWCASQQNNRLGWLALIITAHGCFITPLTILFIFLGGNQPFFWAFTIGAMTMALVVNLAALPTRITIPIFLLSILIDLLTIVNCVVLALN